MLNIINYYLGSAFGGIIYHQTPEIVNVIEKSLNKKWTLKETTNVE